MYEVVFIHFKDSSVTVLAYCFNPRIPAFFAFFARDTGYFSQQRPRPPTQKSMETLSRIGTALTAGCGATLCVHPLDVVRVNLQVDSTGVGKRAYNGTFDCIKKIAARDGAKGLVRLAVPRRATCMAAFQARSLTCVHTCISHRTSHIAQRTSHTLHLIISSFAPRTPPQPPPHPLAVRRVERGDSAADDVRRPAHGDIPDANGHGKGQVEAGCAFATV